MKLSDKEKAMIECRKVVHSLAVEFKSREDEHVKFLAHKESNNPYKRFSEEEKREIKRKERDFKVQVETLTKDIVKLQAKTAE